ncbi:MAG: hypothetical protein IKZ37_04245 [Bacteroidaceae bacterium]|nr:hypothetical protein [Bacteroidaceae bacterium]
MGIVKFILWMVALAAFLVLQILTLDDVFIVVWNSLSRYWWFVAGVVLIFLADKYTSKNNSILKTFHHETTHLFVGIVTFRKILNFKVDIFGGLVASAGKRWMYEVDALAPYCLPLAAYVVMFFGFFFANDMTHILTIMLGIAYGFHLLCIKEDFGSWKQLGIHQTDINQFPLLFSYMYILCFWLFNTAIILLSIRIDIYEAYKYILGCYKETIVSFF